MIYIECKHLRGKLLKPSKKIACQQKFYNRKVSMQVKDFRIRLSLKLDLYDFPTIDLLRNLRAVLFIVVCVPVQICKTYRRH